MSLKTNLVIHVFFFAFFSQSLLSQDQADCVTQPGTAERLTMKYQKGRKSKEVDIKLGQLLTIRLLDDSELRGNVIFIGSEGLCIGRVSVDYKDIKVFRYIKPPAKIAIGLGAIAVTTIALAFIVPEENYQPLLGVENEDQFKSILLVGGGVMAATAVIIGTSRNLHTRGKDIIYQTFDRQGVRLN